MGHAAFGRQRSLARPGDGVSPAATQGQDRSSFNTEPGLRSSRFIQKKRTCPTKQVRFYFHHFAELSCCLQNNPKQNQQNHPRQPKNARREYRHRVGGQRYTGNRRQKRQHCNPRNAAQGASCNCAQRMMHSGSAAQDCQQAERRKKKQWQRQRTHLPLSSRRIERQRHISASC